MPLVQAQPLPVSHHCKMNRQLTFSASLAICNLEHACMQSANALLSPKCAWLCVSRAGANMARQAVSERATNLTSPWSRGK